MLMSKTESPEMPEQVQWVSKYTITKEVFHNRSFITIYIAENSVLILSWIQWISVVRKAIDNRYQEKTLANRNLRVFLQSKGEHFSTCIIQSNIFKNLNIYVVFAFFRYDGSQPW